MSVTRVRTVTGLRDGICASCFFGCALSPRAQQLIVQYRRVDTWEKGDTVFRAGEEPHGIWSVCSGRIKVFKDTETGKQLTLRIAVPGDLVGHRSLLAGTPLSGYGSAMERSVTAYLPARVVTQLIEIDPDVRVQIIQKLASELGHAESLATNMAYSRAEKRLIAAFAELCRNRGGCAEDPFDVVAPRQELAELAGLTVEATVRTLRRLEEAGIVTAHGHRIVINDPSIVTRADDE